eukprot:6459048-Amphidinium_carterae.3
MFGTSLPAHAPEYLVEIRALQKSGHGPSNEAVPKVELKGCLGVRKMSRIDAKRKLGLILLPAHHEAAVIGIRFQAFGGFNIRARTLFEPEQFVLLTDLIRCIRKDAAFVCRLEDVSQVRGADLG